MATAVLLLTYDQRGRPSSAALAFKKHLRHFELFRAGNGKRLSVIFDAVKQLRDFVCDLSMRGHHLVVSGFKDYYHHLSLPCDLPTDLTHDCHLSQTTLNNFTPDELATVARRLAGSKLLVYQNLLAKAAVVYHSLEHDGLLLNYTSARPRWSLDTHSGRSKSSGFNIQGHTGHDLVCPAQAINHSVLICFDWIAADIRAAAHLSNDTALTNSFITSDPYTVLGLAANMPRPQAKLHLLKTINSLRYDDPVVNGVFPTLCQWLRDQQATIDGGGSTSTVLGRRYSLANSRSALSAHNGSMQGTVAHGVHHMMRRAWEMHPSSVVADIYDSIVISCPNGLPARRAIISSIVPLMLRPIIGHETVCYPVRVSVGTHWKQWQLLETWRDSGVTEELPPTSATAEVECIVDGRPHQQTMALSH
jgi:hypothetical protein